ncbi:MAG: translocation/assembly module TamB domain-containing protein [Candidatus Omnitrophota bacterium]
MAVEQALKIYSSDDTFEFESVDGDLITGMRFYGLRLKDWKELPENCEVRVDELYVIVSSFDIDGVNIQAVNARLQVPGSADIVLNGSFDKGNIDAVLQSDSVDVRRLAGHFLKSQDIEHFPGFVKHLDAQIQGHYTAPAVRARLVVTDIKELPENSELTVEEIYVKASSFDFDGLDIQGFQARLKVPGSTDIVLNGSFNKGNVEAGVQSDSIDVRELAGHFFANQDIKYLPGMVTHLDAKIRGHYTTPAVTARLTVTGLKELPENSEFKIQELFVKVNSFDINGLDVRINNARLKLPVSDPVVLNGDYSAGELNAVIYTTSLDVSEIAGYIPKNSHTNYLQGLVKKVDVRIQGRYENPVVTGNLLAVELDNRMVTLKESPVEIDLKFKDILSYLQVSGEVALNKGKVTAKRTSLKLKPSKLYFSGNPENPRLDINGETTISKVLIHVGVEGTLEEPEINLSSEPSLPEHELFLMLATGKKWESIDESIATGSVSPKLTKDLIEFMFFGGTGNKVAERFGLTDFSVSFGPDRKGIGASKKLSEGVEVKYEVQSETDPAKTTNNGVLTQKVGSEIRVSKRITLDINKEFKNTDGTNLGAEEVEEAEIMMKYKINF